MCGEIRYFDGVARDCIYSRMKRSAIQTRDLKLFKDLLVKRANQQLAHVWNLQSGMPQCLE